MTMTFHHSGWSPLRVVSRWSWPGSGTLPSADAGAPSTEASRERSMVAGWSMQVMAAEHWLYVTGGVAYNGTGMYSGSMLPFVCVGEGGVWSATPGGTLLG